MSRRKPIDAKILEASKAFDAHIFAETIKPTFRRFHSAIFFFEDILRMIERPAVWQSCFTSLKNKIPGLRPAKCGLYNFRKCCEDLSSKNHFGCFNSNFLLDHIKKIFRLLFHKPLCRVLLKQFG